VPQWQCTLLYYFNVSILLVKGRVLPKLVPRAFFFRGWMVSEKGPGFGWSVFVLVNDFIQYMWE
jgi:hypothetical protein